VASQERQSSSPLKDRLLKEFYAFSFFEAVHLLELLFPKKKPLGQTLVPEEEVVRFSVKPGLAFPPCDISGMKLLGEEGPVEMEIPFMGLIGPSGVLPHWYNELAMERIRQRDFSLTAFFDLFHHRLISLFYLAWGKYRFLENYLPEARDKHSRCLLSLMGLGTRGLGRRTGLPEESLIFFSGLLTRPVPSAVAIEAAAEYFSGVTVEVEQFIDRVISFGLEEQTQLGSANAQLGVDAVIGSTAWESQTKFLVRLGPMGYAQFLHLLPSGKSLGSLFSLVRYMAGIEYEFEIRLVLKPEEVPLCQLGAKTPGASRLGWTTWVKTPGFTHEENPYVTFEETDVPLKS
jgi:type VI secretion system protein ImpH